MTKRLLKRLTGIEIEWGRMSTTGGEERGLTVWKFARWEVRLTFWRSL